MMTASTKKVLVLGVTGSIAAYKAGDIVRRAQDAGFNVRVMMTPAAQELVAPLTFESLSGNKVACGLFDRTGEDWQSDHIALAQDAEIVLVAPATANTIAKLACGLADDIVSCTVLATRAPVLVAPAMNTNMWLNPATVANISRLKQRGVHFVEPVKGRLACGDEGQGHLADVADILTQVAAVLAKR